MNAQIEELLIRLEEVNDRAVKNSDPELQASVDTARVLEFIKERGELLEQLRPLLAANAPVSYIEWNRLVVIHHQGSRMLENLKQVRSRVASELGTNSSGRHFLERLTGILPSVQSRG